MQGREGRHDKVIQSDTKCLKKDSFKAAERFVADILAKCSCVQAVMRCEAIFSKLDAGRPRDCGGSSANGMLQAQMSGGIGLQELIPMSGDRIEDGSPNVFGHGTQSSRMQQNVGNSSCSAL